MSRRNSSSGDHRVVARVDDLLSSAQIRHAALHLFAQNGARATSLRSIAAAAGVSLGAVEHHFPTKAALEAAVAVDVVELVRDAVDGVGADLPARDALRARRQAWTELVAAHADLRSYVRRALLDVDGPGREAIVLLVQEEQTQLSTLVEHGLARRTDDFEATVAVYFAMVSTATILGPVLDELFGIDVRRPEDLARLQRAEIDILTSPLFPPDVM